VFELFSSGGGQRLADEIGTPLLASVPLQPRLAEFADVGRPIVLAEPRSPAARVLQQLAERVHSEAGTLGSALPILEG
jgi:ATP-binding protein involved in chromosome partitioning